MDGNIQIRDLVTIAVPAVCAIFGYWLRRQVLDILWAIVFFVRFARPLVKAARAIEPELDELDESQMSEPMRRIIWAVRPLIREIVNLTRELPNGDLVKSDNHSVLLAIKDLQQALKEKDKKNET